MKLNVHLAQQKGYVIISDKLNYLINVMELYILYVILWVILFIELVKSEKLFIPAIHLIIVFIIVWCNGLSFTKLSSTIHNHW